MIQYVHTISVEDYHFLRKAVGFSAIESSQAKAGIQNSSYLIAAVDGEKTVGMARLISDGGYVALIADVIVLPEYQGQGIGKHLMQSVMDRVTCNLKEGQTVFVNLMAAKGKESFYTQFGFAARPNENGGSGMTQWIKGHALAE